MSITDLEQIDGAGIDQKYPSRLNLMIADNLDWGQPDIHLEILEDKLNNYYHYIKSGQYVSKFHNVNEFFIIIYFKYALIKEAEHYLESVSKILNKEKIFIDIKIDK